MQLLTSLLVLIRARLLARQMPRIQRTVHALPAAQRARLNSLTQREIAQAARSDFPHLYGTPPEARCLPWGHGTGVGYERACSPNTEVAVRGLALWLAVAHHETSGATHAGMQAQHRQIAQLLRQLKELRPAGSTVDQWLHAGEAA
jgi:hypothetical protein